MSRRKPKLPTRPRPLDPLNRAIVGDDDFEPVIPGVDPAIPIEALADDNDNVIVDDSDYTSVRVEA